MGHLIAFCTTPSGTRVSLHRGDLTREFVDVIVNAANSQLAHGDGVAAAIVRAGGRAIQDECTTYVQKFGPVPVGEAAWTGPGEFALKGIIHAVGPMWGEGDEPGKLRRAALASFVLAAQNECGSLALPAISSGIFGFPKRQCAEVLVKSAWDFLMEHPVEPLQEIRFTIIDEETVSHFRDEFVKKFGVDCLCG